MIRILGYLAFGPFVGLGAWLLVVGFFTAGLAIRAIEAAERRRC